MPQDLLDHVGLRGFKKRDYPHLALAFWAVKRINLIDPLDLPAGRQVSMAQVWLHQLGAGASGASPLAGTDALPWFVEGDSAAFLPIRRALFEYQP